jgi:hypothetical protein
MFEPGHRASFFTSEEMREIFNEYFGPCAEKRGFVYVGKNRWVRETNAGFKHLFYLYPFGADYYSYGALSFDYVPRVNAGKVRIRPELKYTEIHITLDKNLRDVNFERSRSTARQKCLAQAEPVTNRVCGRLDCYRTLEDVMPLFQAEKKSLYFYNFRDTALSYAFTLAKVGESVEAKAELNKIIERSCFPIETHAALRDCLDQLLIASTSRN